MLRNMSPKDLFEFIIIYFGFMPVKCSEMAMNVPADC
jgi:hypothetical protein